MSKLINLFHTYLSKLLRRNTRFTPAKTIVQQMNEPRPLPTGVAEFEEWSDRLISGAMITATLETQKATLANMILHLGPTESHKPDAYFIHSLRKLAANQVAHEMFTRLREEVKERLAKEETAAKAAEATTGLKVVSNAPMED